MDMDVVRVSTLIFVSLTRVSSFNFQKITKCNLRDLFAECEIQPNIGKSDATTGRVEFRQFPSLDSCTMGDLYVDVLIESVPVTNGISQHGLHVHTSGNMTRGCDSMGPHFNPYNSSHGAPWNHPNQRHVGDFGNVKRGNDGTIRTIFKDYLATLHGPNTIIGRGLVLHEGTDDLGLGGAQSSLTTGNSGPRLACCVIRIS